MANYNVSSSGCGPIIDQGMHRNEKKKKEKEKEKKRKEGEKEKKEQHLLIARA